MLIVHVHIHVKDEFIQPFKQACIENARESLQETGIVRFDVLQNQDEPNRFILNEVYRSEEATRAHKETEHYKRWREAVEHMMAEPRYSVKYINIFPDDEYGW